MHSPTRTWKWKFRRTHEAGAQLVRAPGAAGFLPQHDEELAAAAAGELPVDLGRRLATVTTIFTNIAPMMFILLSKFDK